MIAGWSPPEDGGFLGKKTATQQLVVGAPAIDIHDRGVEQLVARRAHNPKVAGSSPVPATSEESLSSID